MDFPYRVEFPAWQGDRYVGLAEVLVVLGAVALDIEWSCRIDEVAPEPGAEGLENLRPEVRISTLDLLSLVAPDRQVIDGAFEGYSLASGEQAMSILAIDSSFWVVESGESFVVEQFGGRYPSA